MKVLNSASTKHGDACICIWMLMINLQKTEVGWTFGHLEENYRITES